MKCEFTLITYGSKWITWKEQVPLIPQECRKRIKCQEYIMDGTTWTLTLGTQTSKQLFIHGQVDSNRNCQVEDFSVNGAQYKGHYLEAFVMVQTKCKRDGRYHRRLDHIHEWAESDSQKNIWKTTLKGK